MPSKKKETEETQTEATPEVTETSEETSMEAGSATDSAETTEETPTKTLEAKADTAEEPSFVDSIIETVSSAVGSVAETVGSVAETVASAIGLSSGDEKAKATGGNRAQRVGVVTSDKMMKTVVVRVDRLVKHPKYRRYVRQKKQFMAHDEHGAAIGDKVRIIETRPLSARKRWRVIEIVQKAAK